MVNLLDPSNVIKSMFDAGRYEKMHDYCKQMLARDPDDMTALQNIALALICMERHGDALPYCDRVLKLRPYDEYALRNRLTALEALDMHDEAVKTCKQMLQSNPRDVTALTGVALALTRTGRHAESLPYYDRALEASPGDVTALLNKALSMTHLGRYEDALRLYDAAEGRVDKQVARDVSAARSRIFAKLGRGDEAFLAAQGVRDGDMGRIISDAKNSNCSVFHQFCNKEYSEMLSGDA